ncbi:MAG: hypothetical protein ACFFD4_31560, partial [Candidatus Odinarchaeota archaeon]
FSIITIALLLFFYFSYTSVNQKELVVFTITLFNGIDVVLSVLSLDSFLAPLIDFTVIPLNIFLFLYLGLIIATRYRDDFPNAKIVIYLAALGLFCVFVSNFLEKVNIKDLAFYSLITGNLVTLGSAILFSTTAILIPFLKNQISSLKFILLLFVPLLASLVLLMGISNQQLLIQIITTSLAQTLNLTVFRVIPGVGFSTQKLFLVLSISTILLTASGIVSSFSNHKERKNVAWILIIEVLGLEISTPFINVLRLLAIYMLSNVRFPVRFSYGNENEENLIYEELT